MRKRLSKLGIGCAVVICCSLSACKQGVPKEVIKPAAMEAILYDYNVAKSMAEDLPYDERYKQPLYTDYVFQKHRVTQAQFDSSLVWYTRNTEELSKIYANVAKRFKDEQGAINHLIAIRDHKPKMSERGDTVNVWYDKKLYKLTPTFASDRITFTLPTDSNFKAYDEIRWKMRYHFLKPQPAEAIMAMSLTFDNDSILAKTKKIDKSGWYTLSLKSDSSFKIKEISGFVYLPEDSIKSTLLIDEISLFRYHRPEQDSINKAKQKVLLNDSLKNDSIKKAKELSTRKDSVKKQEPLKVEQEQPSRRNPHDMDRPRPRKGNNREVRR